MSQRFAGRARLLSSTAAALALMGGVAHAQATAPGVSPNQTVPAQVEEEGEATQVDEIVVTGIRRAIEESISAKANNTSIVEVISAEDIGKLPDVSIAESLARLPGVAQMQIEPVAGVGDSGDLQNDLPELLVAVGEAAKARNTAVVLLIDELQYRFTCITQLM